MLDLPTCIASHNGVDVVAALLYSSPSTVEFVAGMTDRAFEHLLISTPRTKWIKPLYKEQHRKKGILQFSFLERSVM
jgi:hypothetical protein